MSNQLVWFRNDLRIADHQALSQAIDIAKSTDSECFALYLWSENQLLSQGAGINRFRAIEQALNSLKDSLANIGIRLNIITVSSWQDSADALLKFVQHHQITDIHCHFEPGYDEYNRDKNAKIALGSQCNFIRYNDLFLIHPAQNLNKQKDFYRVFSAYKKSTLVKLQSELTAPRPAPTFKHPINVEPVNLNLISQWENPLNLPTTEKNAHDRLEIFLENECNYADQRDIPSVDGTSKLSVALSLGILTSRQIAWALLDTHKSLSESTYFSEIIWREFYKYLTYFRNDLCIGKPFNEKWDKFPWRSDMNLLECWQKGQTGVPIVDAAMHQLNQTGWMHNRLRMVTAMYLTKIMQLDWRVGEKYFASQLADFDFCANNGGWQWVASTGVDAVPYFRIFNPHQQSKRFDPDGKFIRKYLPELGLISSKEIHDPDMTKYSQTEYPSAILDYKAARTDTLNLFKSL